MIHTYGVSTQRQIYNIESSLRHEASQEATVMIVVSGINHRGRRKKTVTARAYERLSDDFSVPVSFDWPEPKQMGPREAEEGKAFTPICHLFRAFTVHLDRTKGVGKRFF